MPARSRCYGGGLPVVFQRLSVATGLTARGAAFARPGGGPDAVWRSPDLAIETSIGAASTPDVRVEGDFEEDARGPPLHRVPGPRVEQLRETLLLMFLRSCASTGRRLRLKLCRSTRCGKQDVVSPWTRSNSFVGLGPLQDRTTSSATVLPPPAPAPRQALFSSLFRKSQAPLEDQDLEE